MKIHLLYFASLREALSIDRETLIIEGGKVLTTSDLRTYLQTRSALWAEQFAAGRPLRVAVNQQMVNGEASLHEGAEVAFFPPVTGG